MANHSKKFNLVRTYYKGGFWKKRQLENAVKKGWITSDEYEEITGEAYPKQETAEESVPVSRSDAFDTNAAAGDVVEKESIAEDAEEDMSEESASDSEE